METFWRYWPFVRGIHRSSVDSSQKGRNFDVFFDQRLNKRLSKNGDTGDLRRHRAHYDVTVIPRKILIR